MTGSGGGAFFSPVELELPQDHLPVCLEKKGGGRALHAKQRVDPVFRFQGLDRNGYGLDFLADVDIRMVPGELFQKGEAVFHLGTGHVPGKAQDEILVEHFLVLGESKGDVFRIGGGHLPQQFAPAGKESQFDAVFHHEAQGLSGELDVSENQNAFYFSCRHIDEDVFVLSRHEPVSSFLQDRPLFGHVDECHVMVPFVSPFSFPCTLSCRKAAACKGPFAPFWVCRRAGKCRP